MQFSFFFFFFFSSSCLCSLLAAVTIDVDDVLPKLREAGGHQQPQLHEYLEEGAAISQYEGDDSSTILHLPVGLNFSVGPAYDQDGVSRDASGENSSMFSVGMPNLDWGVFFPILSSPAFNSSLPAFNSSLSDTNRTAGYAFGFYIWCKDASQTQCSLYMAVCAGFSGNLSTDDPSYNLGPTRVMVWGATRDGFAVPMWIANLHPPNIDGLKDVLKASLVVVASHTPSVPELQLRTGQQVLWSLSNVSSMQISDSGEFAIYDSISRRNAPLLHFDGSNDRDTSLLGQRLLVGRRLTSNDSAYSASMENGGLVLFLNALGRQAPPYWILPFLRSADASNPNLAHDSADPSIAKLIISPLCSDMQGDPPNLHFSNIGIHSVFLVFEAGSCKTPGDSNDVNLYYRYYYDVLSPEYYISWGFLRLESDGRLYIYTVSMNLASNRSIPVALRKAVDDPYLLFIINNDIDIIPTPPTSVTHIMQDVGMDCDVPLACGPLGVCTPRVKPLCSCPNDDSWEPRNETDITQGCKLHNTSLAAEDLCKEGATTLKEFNALANIFLLNGWTIKSTRNADACKQACSHDCSCQGVSYRVSTNSCFLITHDLSLLAVQDKDIVLWNYTAPLGNNTPDVNFTITIDRNDYVTFLKVPKPDSKSFLPVPKPDNYKSVPLKLVLLIGITPFISVLIGVGACQFRRRRREFLQRAREEEELRDLLPLLPTRFSYKHLREATKGFSAGKLLGKGGCGSVYAGTLADRREVAVKVLEGAVLNGAGQTKEFLAEVAAVGRAGHNNIVRLLGFCWEASHRILMFEYLQRGSLDRWLFMSNDDDAGVPGRKLDWRQRYNIALGIARGLHYLHEECEQPILHFDIKPQNILLTEEFTAKIADFGMSRSLMQRDMSAVVTGVRGTLGYMSASKKCDIYSMGVVMLEIVAGRRALDYSVAADAVYLPRWAKRKWREGALMDIVDPRLYQYGAGELSKDHELQAQRLLYAALWCVQGDPTVRPSVDTVMQWLESNDGPVPEPPLCSSTSTSMHSSTSDPGLQEFNSLFYSGR